MRSDTEGLSLLESASQIGPGSWNLGLGQSLESWAGAELIFPWDILSKKRYIPYHF